MTTKQQKLELQQTMRRATRSFFEARGYLEAQTPSFVASPDIEPTLTHFESTLEARVEGGLVKRTGALVTSPEYALKKIVGPDVERVFELARVWRNGEPMDATHNAEFTMLEWYNYKTTFTEGIEETIAFIQAFVQEVSGRDAIERNGIAIPLARDQWQVVSVAELFAEHCDMQLNADVSIDDYRAALDQLESNYDDTDTIGDLFQRLFLNFIQPKIDTSPVPVLVYGYPKHEATLARIGDDGFAERFEIYVAGVELCNAYGELTDAAEQRARFEAEQEERQRIGKTVFPIDEALLQALGQLDQPLFGNALGIERLMMLAAGLDTLEDLLLFPTAKLFNIGTD